MAEAPRDRERLPPFLDEGTVAGSARVLRPTVVAARWVLVAVTGAVLIWSAVQPAARPLLTWCLVWLVLLGFGALPQRWAMQLTSVVLAAAAVLSVASASGVLGLQANPADLRRWFALSVTVGIVGIAMHALGRRLRHRAALAEAVAQLGQQALLVTEPDDMLQAALGVAVDVLDTDYGTALRRLPDGKLRVAAELGADATPIGTIIPLAERGSYARYALESPVPLVSSDLRRETRVTPPLPLIERGIVSGIAVQVLGEAGPLGVLAVHSRRRRRFADYEVSSLQAMANVVATAWEQATHREQLSHQALHDPLTGLPNRALLLNRLEQALSRRRLDDRPGQPGVAVALIDLDRFKNVNDGLGHAAGDSVLREVGRRIAAAVRPEDTLARFGGDEFAFLCEDVTDDQVSTIARRILDACAQPLGVEQAALNVTASVGVTLTYGRTGERGSADSLLREADIALHRAKIHGGARVELFNEQMQAHAQARLLAEVELKRAIEQQELVLHYQPIRSAGTQALIGIEALVRWQHPQRGLLGPEEFLPLAEQSGLIVPLGRWVLRQACVQTAAWQRELEQPLRALRVAVNVSPRQLEDLDLPAQVAQAIAASGLAAGTLALELTETALLATDESGHAALTRLIDAGATLILDDFGTGYSSLTHLARFPIQSLKIDRSFVAGLGRDGRDTAIVAAMIALGAELGVNVIAEGIETPAQLQILQQLRCPAVQGFLLDHPRPQPIWTVPPRLLPSPRTAEPSVAGCPLVVE